MLSLEQPNAWVKTLKLVNFSSKDTFWD